MVTLLDSHLQARLPVAHTAKSQPIACLSEERSQIPLPSSDREENPYGAESTEEGEDGARRGHEKYGLLPLRALLIQLVEVLLGCRHAHSSHILQTSLVDTRWEDVEPPAQTLLPELYICRILFLLVAVTHLLDFRLLVWSSSEAIPTPVRL